LKLDDICVRLKGRFLCGEEQGARKALAAFGADLMSDVLANVDGHCLLLTGLVNEHVVRTAEMVDACAVVFAGGKLVMVDVVDMAKSRDLPLIITDMTLYEACGVLYGCGLPSK
jgi:predicted transcriptional regulator